MRTVVIDEKKNFMMPNENEKIFFEEEFDVLKNKSCFYDFAAQSKASFYLDDSQTEKSAFVGKIAELFKN